MKGAEERPWREGFRRHCSGRLKKALLYSKCTRVKADRSGLGGVWGVKSVQTQDLEAEQNDIARHAGRLEVKNAAAKLNE